MLCTVADPANICTHFIISSYDIAPVHANIGTLVAILRHIDWDKEGERARKGRREEREGGEERGGRSCFIN